LGADAEAKELLAPLDRIGGALADTRAALPVAALGTITAEPTDPSPGIGRTGLLSALDDTAAALLLADPIDPLVGVQLRHLGGALRQSTDNPLGPLTADYTLTMVG